MLTKNRIREIVALADKKGRLETGLFMAEGKKIITDLLNSTVAVEFIYTTANFTQDFTTLCPGKDVEITEVSETEIGKISQMKTPQGCLAVCKIPRYPLPAETGSDDLALCLDDIQDPGNFGTLLRTADWFCISDVFCSPGTVDTYNPKVVQATMGAISRVRIHYLSLAPFLQELKDKHIPLFGTFLEGENLYSANLPENGVIVLGNEGKGINEELAPLLTHKLTIPGFYKGKSKPDSLNVSIAASIIVSEFRRQHHFKQEGAGRSLTQSGSIV